MPLKKSEIEEFKQKLIKLRGEVVNEIEEANSGMKTNEMSKGYSQHAADEGTEDFEKSVMIQFSNTELSILRQIDRALEKIEENTYGICDITGEEIPKKRLEAVSYANMTVEAQEQLEKTNS